MGGRETGEGDWLLIISFMDSKVGQALTKLEVPEGGASGQRRALLKLFQCLKMDRRRRGKKVARQDAN